MIFGTGQPRIIYRHGLSGETSIDLDYAIVSEMIPETQWLEHVSELDLNKDVLYRGIVWKISIMLNLYKYANPLTAYQALAAQKGHELSLYRHRDGNPFRVSSSADMMFVLKEITPMFVTTTDYKDGLLLSFESTTCPSSAQIDSLIDFGAWLTWGQTDIAPLGDTGYNFGTLT